MSGTDSVTVTTRVAVSPRTAFEVFTSEVDRWWKRGPAWRFGEGREGVLRFEGEGAERVLVEAFDGGERHVVGRVLVWEPGVRLSFEFRGRGFAPDEHTRVDVHFDDEPDGRAERGEGTRVTLIHRGWDALPADHPARHGLRGGSFESAIGGWWSMHLVGLGSEVVGKCRGVPGVPGTPRHFPTTSQPSPGSEPAV